VSVKLDADRDKRAEPPGGRAPRVGRRPPARDAEATKQRILKASRAEFARCGYSGARVDRIARAARTNKRMLYYHVGNKDALYLEALEAAYADIRAAEQQLRLEEMEPLAAIERLVRFTWDYFLATPEFIALLNTENLHKARHIKRSRHIGNMNSPVVATVGRILEEGVRRALIRPGIYPLQLYISIAALCYFYLSNVHTLTAVFDGRLKGQPALDARVAHVVDLVLNGLRRK